MLSYVLYNYRADALNKKARRTATLNLRPGGTNVIKQEDDIMYQMCKLDPNGEPYFGQYFFDDINEDITKLGIGDLNKITSDGRVKVKITLDDNVDFLKSKTANIEDWDGSGQIFEGGGNQFYNPTAKTKIKSYEILQ